jgi:hypothetical protein
MAGRLVESISVAPSAKQAFDVAELAITKSAIPKQSNVA